MHPDLVHLSPLKPEIVTSADVLFVRELVAGTYFAKPKKMWRDGKGTLRAVDTCAYTEPQVERTVRVAFELARGRRKRLHVADKQNVMATSRLWRDVTTRVVEEEFRIGDVNSSPAFFDIKKLTAFNGEYIRALSLDAFVQACQPRWCRVRGAFTPRGGITTSVTCVYEKQG